LKISWKFHTRRNALLPVFELSPSTPDFGYDCNRVHNCALYRNFSSFLSSSDRIAGASKRFVNCGAAMRVDVREIIATAEQIAVLIEVRDMLKRKTPR
jgi:hypothetical protein